MKKNLFIGYAYKNNKASNFDNEFSACKDSLPNICLSDVNNGCDGFIISDLSDNDIEHDSFMGLMRLCARVSECPIITGGRVHRLEDVKKYLYAGADIVYLDMSIQSNIDIIVESAERFGKDKIYAYINDIKQLDTIKQFFDNSITGLIIDADMVNIDTLIQARPSIDNIIITSSNQYTDIKSSLSNDLINTVMIKSQPECSIDFIDLKAKLKIDGYQVNILESKFTWDQIKTDSNGLLPVIVQDYRTDEVLMLAYMNEEAFSKTISSERMNYYSRSRKTQWLKGETSGHYQYVRSLTLDCDNDTLLAKVFQVGPACHTGAQSCFFNTVAAKENFDKNPRKVLEDVYSVIIDRKQHPKEGSYTNYLFDKGIDKILKKVGEEASEIIIAAKNPDPEEIKYEISDFLYHAMVLMVERGVTWDDICKELANR